MIKIEFNSEMEKEVAPIPVTQSNNNLQNLPEDSFLFYNNSNITILNLDKSLLIKFLPKILSQQTLSKYFSHEDFLKLKSFWSNYTFHCKMKDDFKDFVSDISKNKDAIHLFQSLLKNNYFSYVNIKFYPRIIKKISRNTKFNPYLILFQLRSKFMPS